MMGLRRLLQVFSTQMVKTYDMDWLRDVFTDQLMTRIKEAVSNGVVQGYLNGLEVYADGTELKIKTGGAYINGERADNDALATLTIADAAEVLVRAKYATVADTAPHATRLDDLGNPHTVWYRDSIELYTVDDESPADPDAINLAWASRTGGSVTVTDYREYASLNLPIKDLAVLTAKLANQAVSSAKIANYAVNTDKLLQYAVTESKLAAGTEIIPLAACRDEEAAAGSSIGLPAPFTTYAAATGGAYEYKILGRIYRDAFAGPIRRLRLLAVADSPATSGTAKIYLVAWVGEPADYDPDDPSYDGEVAYQEITPPGGGAGIDIELEGLPAFVADTYHLTYGLVIKNSMNEVVYLTRVILVGLR